MTEREQEYYDIIIDKDPTNQRYEIGSQVKLNCTVNSSDGIVTSYQWSSALYGSYSSRTYTPTIRTYSLNSLVYYCHAFQNGHLLGTQKTTLDIKGVLL